MVSALCTFSRTTEAI